MSRHGRGWLVVIALSAAGVVAGVNPPAARGQPTPQAKPQVYVGDSPAAEDLFEQAGVLRQQGRPLEAVELYQQIIRQYPDKLLEAAGGYTDASRRVAAVLGGDASLLEAYRKKYEAEAERALAEASNPPRGAGLEAVVARFPVCHASLEASLRLAGVYLEEGSGEDAADVLDLVKGHPDFKTAAGRWRELEAVAALLTRRTDEYAQQRAALAVANDAEALARLTAFADHLRLSPQPVIYNPWEQLPATQEAISTSKPLWQVQVVDEVSDTARITMSDRRGSSDLLGGYMAPEADESRIYVNDYLWVTALDRLSGRIVWNYQAGDETVGAMEQNPWLRHTGSMADPRGFAFDGQRIWTITGLVSQLNPRYMPPGAATALLCLDGASGKVLARIEPKDIDASLETAAFHGTPVAVGGRIFAMLRRNQLSGFQDAFVAAFDSRSGRPLWRRYLSSAAALNRQFRSGMAQMLVSGDRIYISDNIGATEALDARTGMIDWLTVMPEPEQDMVPLPERFAIRANGENLSWQGSSPVLVEAGLIVPGLSDPGSGAAGAMLIDPGNGRIERQLSMLEPAWNQADYFMGAGRDVLIVGPKLILLDGKTLEPRWSCPLGRIEPVRPQGRAAVTNDRIFAPLGDRVVIVSLADGARIGEQPLIFPGNLLTLDDQLIVADNQSICSYSTWEGAYARLKEAIAAQPHDPRAGLALAFLAMTTNHGQFILEGADMALATLGDKPEAAPGATRDEVFARLLELAADKTLDEPIRRGLFERLGAIAIGPGDQVAYQLAMGDWAGATGHAAEAVDHYETILTDPTLAAQPFERPAGTRQAGLEARARLGPLVEKAGGKIYERYDALAAQHLAELTAANAEAEAFLELTRQYPLARVVPEALAMSGEALAKAGNPTLATYELRRAYMAGSQDADWAGSAGLLAEAMLQDHQTRAATRWLERVAREHPGLMVLRHGQAVAVETWAADLARQPADDQPYPVLALPLGQPRVLAGQLLTPTDQAEDTWPRDQIMQIEDKKLVLRAGPDLAKHWELPVANPAALELLCFTQAQAMVWDAAAGALMIIDNVTGNVQRPIPDVKALLAQVGDEAQRRASRSLEERAFTESLNGGDIIIYKGRPMTLDQIRDEQGAGVFLEINDWVICVADRKGRLTAVDRRTGRVLWRQFCPMDEVNAMELNVDSLLVAGIDGMTSDATSGVIMVLDPQTGERRLPDIQEKSDISWASMGSEGMILYRTSSEMVARHASDGSVAWRSVLPSEQPAPAPLLCDDLLFSFDPGAGLAVINPATGQNLARVHVQNSEGTESVGSLDGRDWQVRALDQQWQVLTPGAAVALGPDGAEKWRDAINPSPRRLHQFLDEGTVILLGREIDDAQAADENHPPEGEAEGQRRGWAQPLGGQGGPRVPGVPGVPGGPGARLPIPVVINPPMIPGGAQLGPPRRHMHWMFGNMDDSMDEANSRVPAGWLPRIHPDAGGDPGNLMAPAPEGEAGDENEAANAEGRKSWAYKLYVLDRLSGAAREERDLTGLAQPIDAQHAVFLDNRLVMTSGNATLVVPGAGAGAGDK